MADAATHRKKAELAWTLTHKLLKDNAPGFLTINQGMYAVGHLLESHLAEMHMHPSAAARGVPHAERGRLSRAFLVPAGILSEEEMTSYDRLYSQRDTFCDGGMEDPQFVRSFIGRTEQLVKRLQTARK